ncbi:MAG: AAA family ATPase [Christensenellaceae bacterium]|jgi:hypothetical protein|nr:AAA family ATPase [Christensenellaceae bacterium]
MKLIELHARNFKGLRDFHLQTYGDDIDIFGDNATGKTSVYDAFLWLLFGKDSAGHDTSHFSIKPLGADGSVLAPEVEVSATLSIESGARRIIALRKVFSEKWERKRGEASERLTGHETTCFVDGLPVKVTDFQSKIESLIPEDLFRLLTSPYRFSQLPKADARKVLMDMIGGVDIVAALAGKPELMKLEVERGEYDIESYRKMLDGHRREANAMLKQLPARMDEALRGKGPVVCVDLVASEVARKRALVEQYQQEIAASQDGRVAGVKAQIQTIEAELASIERERRLSAQAWDADELRAQSARLQPLEDDMARLQARLRELKSNTETLSGSKAVQERQRDKAREDWVALEAKPVEVTEICPTCGQHLSDEAIQQTRAALEALKDERLLTIQELGELAVKEIGSIDGQMRTGSEGIVAAEKELQRIVAQHTEIAAFPLQSFENSSKAAEYGARKLSLDSQLGDLHSKLVELLRGDTKSDALKIEIDRLRSEIAEGEKQLAQAEADKRADARVVELEAEQRSLGGELESLERKIILCEEYMRAMATEIEKRVNDFFEIVGFRLFVEQINGGLADTCEVVVNGVPWADLNHAMQVNAGLDIISALTRHYGKSAPIFIDNSESVTRLRVPSAQLIRLVVVAGVSPMEITRVESARKEGVA